MNPEMHRRAPKDPPSGTCDWGHCDAVATTWRWCVEHGWLPVCSECRSTMRLNRVHACVCSAAVRASPSHPKDCNLRVRATVSGEAK